MSLYYAEEGIDDLVRIELPPGAKYKPVFTYNPRSEAHKSYARGLVALSGTRLRNAEGYFTRTIRLQPDYAEAYLAVAQKELITPLCPSDISVSQGRRDVVLLHSHGARHSVPRARQSIATALKLNPNLWRAHILSGVGDCYRYEWDHAEQAFGSAIEAAPVEASSDLWYLSYLTAINRGDEALSIVETNIRESPTDAALLTQYGFILYALRRYSEAKRAFGQATDIEPQHWPAYIGKACAVLAHEGPGEALEALGDAERLFPRGLFFPGFVVLCLARLGQVEDARQSFARCMESPTSEVDRALAYMGVGKPGEAVKALAKAYDDHDPLVLWLHLWPIFDPLRNREGFKAIVKRVGLHRSNLRLP